ncbi:MAG TPA: hypothetical protein VJ399_02990 [Patescibacteria group bacterium]|nr:hypothetical protein [Patescibacteria group bacterium]
MKKVFVFLIILLALVTVFFVTETKAQDVQMLHQVFLPIVSKPSEAIWVLNPQLGDPQGWPGYLGETYSYTIDYPYPIWWGTRVDLPDYYYILVGDQATVPPIGNVGDASGGCYGILVTEDWLWSLEKGNLIYIPTGYAVEYWMLVNPSLADPLIWAAQVRELVMQKMNCTDPDIGLYYTPR